MWLCAYIFQLLIISVHLEWGFYLFIFLYKKKTNCLFSFSIPIPNPSSSPPPISSTYPRTPPTTSSLETLRHIALDWVFNAVSQTLLHLHLLSLSFSFWPYKIKEHVTHILPLYLVIILMTINLVMTSKTEEANLDISPNCSIFWTFSNVI